MITKDLLAVLREYYPLNWYGIHGVIHWARVFENGILLSDQPGVNIKVVQLFAVFHDSQRQSELWDTQHGSRGADLVIRLREHCQLNNEEFDQLLTACSLHTVANTHDDITIQACFDADRLDLGRVFIRPDPARLCTPLAKTADVIEQAYRRSRKHAMPDNAFQTL